MQTCAEYHAEMYKVSYNNLKKKTQNSKVVQQVYKNCNAIEYQSQDFVFIYRVKVPYPETFDRKCM